MSDVANQSIQEKTPNDLPCVEYFVRAGMDKKKLGSCQMCQSYFMTLMIMMKHKLIHLTVTSFAIENPPKEVRNFSSGSQCHIMKITKNGVETTAVSVTDIDDYLDSFDYFYNCINSEEYGNAASTHTNTLRYFLQYVRTWSEAKLGTLMNSLHTIDKHLLKNHQKGLRFAENDELSFSDCSLSVILHHTRVFLMQFQKTDIVNEFPSIKEYLKHIYNDEIFSKSCPADREIVLNYNSHLPPEKRLMPQLMEETRSTLINN
ncbi:Chloride intracellular channel protein 2 [Intoshia linei]|uniref:Chloride intracellular channel protein 2 n=1 Tax=Intoshia linei TaxID=1819745 RepID=A0A177BBV2_9BILA|nr:Chloride intracellular channel protein 2 [Intoshia linei]